MQIGIIGLPLSGKSTLFRLLTGGRTEGAHAGGRADVRVGVAQVPDPRLDFLARIYQPRKVTPATIQLTETAGFLPGQGDRARTNEFLNAVRTSDALIHVVRTFESAELPHPRGRVDPLADVRDVDQELLLADLAVAESAAGRLRQSRRRSPEEEATLALLERVQEALGEEIPVRDMGLDEEAARLLRNYAFVSARPLLLALNLSEEQWSGRDYPRREELEAYAARHGERTVDFCARVELEVAEMEPADRQEFMRAYGIEETGIERVAKAAYASLGLVSFLTAGEDEVRAWPVPAGTTAKRAAGKIHSDLERGFIRAEVVAFDDLARLGSMKAVREAGLLRVEGKEYVVQDGDILTIRFNV
ncbi:MAG: redox-regulated ATPase YchF [Bacillota bacterium]|nr:redox-regulated ATPase YchF [Bacillota bacterium]